jgi:hypothetical protein
MTAPKLFISYSWSNAEHERRVIDLATELRQSGVDVVLDKWDLKEGHDAHAFMEAMVTDEEIGKVVIICDEKYAVKADGRKGGVGTETQIISAEIYGKKSQEKFVAVVFEKDEKGKPYLPTYYKTRIYIDLSEPDRYAENFESLLRWVFDKPLHVKPELGSKPAFLSEGDQISSGTSAIFRRCQDAIRNQKPYAGGTLEEYRTLFVKNLERFQLSDYEGELDDAVIRSVNDFLPSRNEAIQVFITIAQYAPEEQFMSVLHRFFEGMIPYMGRRHEPKFDNYKFIVHELFLYALAILLKHERMEQANHLLRQQYYVSKNSDYGKDVMVSFTVFQLYMESLQARNNRAHLLKERCVGIGIDFHHVMQADFVAFMRAEVDNREGWQTDWYPETLIYAKNFTGPFEIFARSVSKDYFNKSKVLLSIEKPDDLEPLLQSYRNGSRRLPKWNFDNLKAASLLGYKNLASRP